MTQAGAPDPGWVGLCGSLDQIVRLGTYIITSNLLVNILKSYSISRGALFFIIIIIIVYLSLLYIVSELYIYIIAVLG